VDSVGVFLWANRAQYAEVSFQTVSDSDIEDIALPTMQEDIDEDGSSIPPSPPPLFDPSPIGSADSSEFYTGVDG